METYDFSVSGRLNRGFQGHITYTAAVPEMDQDVDIRFSFDKREALQNLEELEEGCKKALACSMPDRKFSEEEYAVFYRMPKTEINVSVFHNGRCLGASHRDERVKNIKISPVTPSEGFEPYRVSGGILKIVLHVLNVLNDGTQYELSVKGGTHELQKSGTS